MSKEIEVKPYVICPETLEDRPIAVGYDSEVYRMGNLVLKSYNRSVKETDKPVSPETLLLYWQITNLATGLSKNHGLKLEVPGLKPYPVLINPIIEMYKCKHCGYIKASSLFIPGESLKFSPQEFDPEELTIGLRKLGVDLENKLGVNGINLIPLNVKKSGASLVITDLCSDLRFLKKRIY